MRPLTLMLTRLAAQAAQGQLADARDRVVRTVFLTITVAILAITALLLLTAAAAAALAQWIGTVPALLSMAAAITVVAMFLVLLIRHRPKRRASGLLGKLSPKDEVAPHIAPFTIVAIGLAAGLFLGMRGRS